MDNINAVGSHFQTLKINSPNFFGKSLTVNTSKSFIKKNPSNTGSNSDIKTQRSGTITGEPIIGRIKSGIMRSDTDRSSHVSSRRISQQSSMQDGSKDAPVGRKSKREMSLFNNAKINENVNGKNFLAVDFGEESSPSATTSKSKAMLSINSRGSRNDVDKDGNNSDESKCSERKITKSILKTRHMRTKDVKMQVLDSTPAGVKSDPIADALKTAMQSAANLETKNKTPYPTISKLPEGDKSKVIKDMPQSQHRQTSVAISKKQLQNTIAPVILTPNKRGRPPKREDPKKLKTRRLSIVDNHPDFIKESLIQDPWAPKSLSHFGPSDSRRELAPWEIQARVDTFRRSIAELPESNKNIAGGVHFEPVAYRESTKIDRSSIRRTNFRKSNLRRS